MRSIWGFISPIPGVWNPYSTVYGTFSVYDGFQIHWFACTFMRCLGENCIKPGRDDKTEKPEGYFLRALCRDSNQRALGQDHRSPWLTVVNRKPKKILAYLWNGSNNAGVDTVFPWQAVQIGEVNKEWNVNRAADVKKPTVVSSRLFHRTYDSCGES